jgi:UDP:flavonoid glycosyltransferase YjiC (YdhE family)
LRWAVRQVLGERRFTERAELIASWARRNDGAKRGAKLVEALGR